MVGRFGRVLRSSCIRRVGALSRPVALLSATGTLRAALQLPFCPAPGSRRVLELIKLAFLHELLGRRGFLGKRLPALRLAFRFATGRWLRLDEASV